MQADGKRTVRISGVQRALERRVANPLLRWLLRSPLHHVASPWLVLVAYEGRRSGRGFCFPALYREIDGTVVVVTPRAESSWWRNFREPLDCSVWLRGQPRAATGTVVDGPARERFLSAYFDLYRRLWRSVADPDRVGDELAVVRFDLGSGAARGGR